jgi:hypothetical protein
MQKAAIGHSSAFPSAGKRTDRRSLSWSPDGRTFHQKQVELVSTFEPGRDRHRERAVVRRGAAKTRELEEALTYQTGKLILSVIASSPTDVSPVPGLSSKAHATLQAYDATVA